MPSHRTIKKTTYAVTVRCDLTAMSAAGIQYERILEAWSLPGWDRHFHGCEGSTCAGFRRGKRPKQPEMDAARDPLRALPRVCVHACVQNVLEAVIAGSTITLNVGRCQRDIKGAVREAVEPLNRRTRRRRQRSQMCIRQTWESVLRPAPGSPSKLPLGLPPCSAQGFPMPNGSGAPAEGLCNVILARPLIRIFHAQVKMGTACCHTETIP